MFTLTSVTLSSPFSSAILVAVETTPSASAHSCISKPFWGEP